jgi:hypothetical protein
VTNATVPDDGHRRQLQDAVSLLVTLPAVASHENCPLAAVHETTKLLVLLCCGGGLCEGDAFPTDCAPLCAIE